MSAISSASSVGLLVLQQAGSPLATGSQPGSVGTIAAVEGVAGAGIIDPGGEDDEKLDTMLRKQAGEDAEDADKAGSGPKNLLGAIRFDDIGIYGPAI